MDNKVKVRKDLTGMRFGKLIVIKQDKDYISPKGKHSPQWLCKCDCGKFVTVIGYSLTKKNGTKSCGCISIEQIRVLKRPRYNLIGKRFGRLTVLERAEDYKIDTNNNKKRYACWLCKCDCGNKVIVKQNKLIQNRTKSCGCYRKEVTAKRIRKDLTGMRFGKLLVLEYAGNFNSNRCINEQALWLCKCDCGNNKIIKSQNLISGDTKSCGCMNSFGESEIARLLTTMNIKYKTQYWFDDLKNTTGKHLYFDFAIFNKDKLIALIEYQGIQHYEDYGNFGKLQREVTDKMKIEYCNKNNINLFEIRYDENIDKAITNILTLINVA